MTNDSWIATLSNVGGPKYLAVVTALERALESGKVRPGDRLPTHRELSQRFGVTIATVTKAMAVAARKGLVTTQVGNGTFACERESPADASVPLDLSLNIVAEEIADSALQPLWQSLSSSRLSHSLLGYGSYLPTAVHARNAARWMNGFGAQVRARDILLTVGAHQGLMAAFDALLAPGKTALCEALTYTGIRRIAHYRRVTLDPVPCDESGMLPDALGARLKASSAKVVIVTSTLHNPTTASMSAERRHAIARLCQQHDAYLIEDGINMPLAGDGTPPIASHAPERSILLTGYSKCVSAGFRLGYAVVPSSLRSNFHEALVSAQWIGPHLYVELAEQMLAEKWLERVVNAHREEARRRFELATRILPGVRPVAVPGYHAWVEAPTGPAEGDFALLALRQGVKISPASHFLAASTEAASADTSYRISLGAVRDRVELERALRILSGLSGHRLPTVSTLI